jgi:hypothetical protein
MANVASSSNINIVPVQTEFDTSGNCLGLLSQNQFFYPPTNFANLLAQPHIEVYDNTASIALQSTPALLAPATTLSGSSGITYDSATGIFTFTNAGSYGLSLVVNALATGASQFVYIYADKNLGSGFNVNVNSGKSFQLANNQQTQIVYANSVYRQAGEQTRYYIWSNNTNVALKTTALPNSVGVNVPAIRIQIN